MNSDEQKPGVTNKPLLKEDISKATSELNNLLQIISGTTNEIANIRQGNDGSEQYLSMLRTSIQRAEAVARQLAEQAGNTHQRATMHPQLSGFTKPKKVAEMPVAKPQILVVDDEEMALTLVKQLLTTAGYHVTTAQSGFECLELFRRRPLAYQLVLLDLTMPFMDGEETFHRLREIRPDAPILLCTGFIQNDKLERLMTAGLSGFLRKPFAPDEIVSQVKAILESAKYSRLSGFSGNSSLAG
ncbi:MAG TPA: response regulator [Chthoniobacterales bacterium]|nr:response regulator [Chthoniobacterales bacterium]